jgi:hypothetical protein
LDCPFHFHVILFKVFFPKLVALLSAPPNILFRVALIERMGHADKRSNSGMQKVEGEKNIYEKKDHLG